MVTSQLMITMQHHTPRVDRLIVVFVAALAIIAGAGSLAAPPAAAQASSCQTDLEKLAQKRLGSMEELNRLAKAGKGKLDPIAACPKLRNLSAVESEFLSYLTKNKDWCSIPDNVIENISSGHAKTIKFAAQACNVAAQVKKLQQQQAQQQAAGAAQQAAKLPAGPL